MPCTFQFTFALSFSIRNFIYFQSPNFVFKFSSCLLCHFSFHYSYFTLRLDQFDLFNARVPKFSHLRCHCDNSFSVLTIFCILGGFQNKNPEKTLHKLVKIVNVNLLHSNTCAAPSKKGAVGMDVKKGCYYLCYKKP